MFALGELGLRASPAAPRLGALLEHRDSGVRGYAAFTLGRLGSAAAGAKASSGNDYVFKVALKGARRIWRGIAMRGDQTLEEQGR